ncbi:unnamed protein product [Acanthoscelides obtectus]|uniref:Transposase n=1 Tax=Acanthoscelides obtectus TaxID=200917 RepID=A0A9P0PR30_ACAOB|nr:unnamed protein product [Acanthoscelides obtectus]CAK1653798.1 Transposable element Tc3 transposase [Acanthoscelides obtectus]
MELNREHFRAIIYYNFQRQLSQQECLAELLSVFGNEAPHQSTFFRWYGEFKRGRVSLSDESKVDTPKTAVTQENVDAVRKLIIEDRHVTYREIKASLKISKTSIQKILHEELGVKKLVSRWIPHLLPEEQKAVRVNWRQKTLDPVWVFQGEEKPTKQITFTADWYTTICLIILHQDNASSRTAQKTRQYLMEENVELLEHPPYSPDLSPNDFFTFPKIKNRLRGQRFQSPEEAVEAFKNVVLHLPAIEWNKCFDNWFERMQMCINIRGEYFEKQQIHLKLPTWWRQRSLWEQEWNSIVFSDESRFCLGMHDGRARVRRRRGERRNPQFFFMVWGAIAYGSRSPLIFIRGNMNAQRYIYEVLEPHLLPYLDTLADPTFQQDNARPHVARVTIDFFQHNDVTLLPWPPRSPDLSPIEHVWDMMGRRLLNLQRPPQTLEALREELVVAWNEIPQEDIDHLIRSMPRRVGECVAHQGASTHY